MSAWSELTTDELVAKREEASKAYYLTDAPLMSDADFDELERELATRGIDPALGHQFDDEDIEKDDTKIKHPHKMLSLAKVREIDEIHAWAKKHPMHPNYIVQPKYDGLALSIAYDEKGRFVYAATRGTGTVGENVTHTVRAMMDKGLIPDEIENSEYSGVTYVSGEVYMTYAKMHELNAILLAEEEERKAATLAKGRKYTPRDVTYEAPRNAAAGLLRRKETDRARFLSFVAYGSNHYELEEAEFLSANGFESPTEHFHTVAQSVKDIDAAITEIQNLAGQEFDFDIDGVVIKLRANAKDREKIGANSTSPRWAVAYKYPNIPLKSTVKDVIWNPTRTGRLVPVVIYDKVTYNGNVKNDRATLHNYAQFKKANLAPGDTISITRSNDVIPYFLGKLTSAGNEPFEAPTHWPSPEYPTSLNATGLDLLLHPEAPGNSLATIEYALSSLDVKGVGPSMIEALLEHEKISEPLDIFGVTEEDILSIPGYENSKKTAQLTVAALKKSFDQPLWRWIAAIGLPFIAKNKSPILEQHYGSLRALSEAKLDDLLSLEGFGAEKASSVHNNRDKIKAWSDRLEADYSFSPKPEVVEVKASTGSIDYNGLKVVVTGTFPTMSRKAVEDWVKRHGGKISSSVSSSTDILIAGEKAGSKMAQAQERGVKIVSAEDFEAEA